MKTPHVLGLLVVAVGLTVAIEEYRIANLRTELAAVAAVPGSGSAGSVAATSAAPATEGTDPVSVRPRERTEPALAGEVPEEEEENLATTVRKMWENPASKAMMDQGLKMAVERTYADFIETLDLTEEEADYFRDLLSQGMAAQQEMGMKMLGSSSEERESLMEEMERREEENQEAIETFLNNEEDQQRFDDYKARLPERQQLDGLRASFAGKDLALDGETEERLVEVMHQARMNSGASELEGAEGMRALAEGNMVEEFETRWEAQQAVLQREVQDVLDEPQREAFFEYQKQMKDMQLMGIKMAEKLFPPTEDE